MSTACAAIDAACMSGVVRQIFLLHSECELASNICFFCLKKQKQSQGTEEQQWPEATVDFHEEEMAVRMHGEGKIKGQKKIAFPLMISISTNECMLVVASSSSSNKQEVSSSIDRHASNGVVHVC